MPRERADSTLSSDSTTCHCPASTSHEVLSPSRPSRADACLASAATSSWLKDALRSAVRRDPVDAANDAELLASLLAARCSSHLAGACPICQALVGYAAWIPIDAAPGRMACPSCSSAVSIDDVYASPSVGPSQRIPAQAAHHRPDHARPILYVITRPAGSPWRYLGHHTASQHRDYLAQCAEALLPGETLSYSVS
jgi:hypothetical protein